MIDYDQFQFATAPRTGTAWMIDAFQLCGFGPAFVHYAHIPFNPKHDGKLRVSVVRHPIDWLASCYTTFRQHDINIVTTLDFVDLKFWGSFDSFLCDYLVKCPGAVSRLFDRYKADAILRLEDLPNAFSELAESLGVSESMITVAQSINARNCSDSVATPSPHLRKQVMEAERSFCNTYNYW